MNRILLWSLPLAIAGSHSLGPTWSQVTGERWYRTVVDRYPAAIERIDDQGAFARFPTAIDPGTHRLVLHPVDPGRFIGGTVRDFTLDAEPCKRYYINAQFKNSIQPEWMPVIDHVEDIVGCKIEGKK